MHRHDFIETFDVLVSTLNSNYIVATIGQLKHYAPHVKDNNHRPSYFQHRDTLYEIVSASRDAFNNLSEPLKTVLRIVDGRANIYTSGNLNKLIKEILTAQEATLVAQPLFYELEFLHSQLIQTQRVLGQCFTETDSPKEGFAEIRIKFKTDNPRFTAEEFMDFMGGFTDLVQTIQHLFDEENPVELSFIETGSPEVEFVMYVLQQASDLFNQLGGTFEGFAAMTGGYFTFEKLRGNKKNRDEQAKHKKISQIVGSVDKINNSTLTPERKAELTAKLEKQLDSLTSNYQIDAHGGETVDDRLGRKWYNRLMLKSADEQPKLPPGEEQKLLEAPKNPPSDEPASSQE